MTEKNFIRLVKAMQKRCSGASCENCDFCKICEVAAGMNYVAKFNPEDFIKAADEWCKEHPAVSYIEDFTSKFPNAGDQIYHDLCRCRIYGGECPYGDEMDACVKCWNEEKDEESGNADESKAE